MLDPEAEMPEQTQARPRQLSGSSSSVDVAASIGKAAAEQSKLPTTSGMQRQCLLWQLGWYVYAARSVLVGDGICLTALCSPTHM